MRKIYLLELLLSADGARDGAEPGWRASLPVWEFEKLRSGMRASKGWSCKGAGLGAQHIDLTGSLTQPGQTLSNGGGVGSRVSASGLGSNGAARGSPSPPLPGKRESGPKVGIGKIFLCAFGTQQRQLRLVPGLGARLAGTPAPH